MGIFLIPHHFFQARLGPSLRICQCGLVNKRRLFFLALLLLTLALFYGLGGSHYLSLEYLKAHQQSLVDLARTRSTESILIYCAIYVFLTAVAFPGVWTFSLVGGFLFGFWWGTLWVALSATLGAILSFLSARFMFHDFLQHRFQDKIQTFNEGVRTEGSYYLFAMRMNPVVPFVLINVVMGLTPMSLWTYSWITAVSMLPGTFLYVNAGLQLSEINSAADILSPGFLSASILLGVFPFFMKWLFKKRARARYQSPETTRKPE